MPVIYRNLLMVCGCSVNKLRRFYKEYTNMGVSHLSEII